MLRPKEIFLDILFEGAILVTVPCNCLIKLNMRIILISAEGVEAKIVALETVVSDLNALNAERTRLVNAKADQAGGLSDYLVQVRSAVKGVFGANSSEYDMVGGTRTSERKHYTKKAGESEGAE